MALKNHLLLPQEHMCNVKASKYLSYSATISNLRSQKRWQVSILSTDHGEEKTSDRTLRLLSPDDAEVLVPGISHVYSLCLLIIECSLPLNRLPVNLVRSCRG